MDNYRPQLVTGPTIEPVTLDQAKKQVELSVTDTAHDEHLLELITRAREEFETDCDHVVCQQTWKVFTSSVTDGMQLQKAPIISITSMQYYNASNTITTLPTTVYNFDAANRRIQLQYNQIWPSHETRWDAWAITYLCGYATLPGIAVQAMLMLVEKYFLGRELRDAEFANYQRLILKMQRSTYP